jgi:RNA polymerase-binding transcription factor DksA
MERNVTTRYSDGDLAEFEVLIKEKLLNARKELEFNREQIIELHENSSNQQGGDYFDDSSLHTELEMLNQMVSRQRQFVQNLENALIRIKNKTYGICIATGELIDKKRLLLVPHATKSVEAKKNEAEKPEMPMATSAFDSMSMFDRDGEEEREPPTRTSRTVTKIVKKVSPTKKAAAPVDEDLDFLDADDLAVVDDDFDYDDDVLNVDIDDIPDDADETGNDIDL